MLINDASITGSLIVNASASFQNISVGGNIIPDTTNIRNLGSTDKYFKEIYVSTGSINFVDGGSVVAVLSAGTITAIQSNTSSANSRLNSIESVSASLQSFTASISTTNTFTSSATARLNALETTSASIDTLNSTQNNRLGSLETISASNISRISALETTSASVDTLNTTQNSRLNALETTSASVDTLNTTQNSRLTSLEITTGSLATTGSNTFIGTQTITGSLFISSDLVVQGSSSLQNITASAVSIGTNIINLNTANPAIRYAGLSIGDSGSIGSSGSFLYDSVQDEMIFIHRGDSSVVTSSVVLMGPQTFDNIGSETYPTLNIVQKGTGNEHLVDSCIFDNGTTICVKNNLIGTGTMSGTTIYGSTAVCSPVGKFTTCLDLGGALTGTSATFSSTNTATAFIPSGATVPTNGMYLSAANTVDFATNTTNRLTITSGGDVAIGADGNSIVKLLVRGKDSGSSNYAFIAQNSSTTNLFLVKNDGNVSAYGSMSGTTIYGSTAVCSPVGLFSGCVGIGTTAPYTKLQVNNGNISVLSSCCTGTDGASDVRRVGFGFKHPDNTVLSALINTTAAGTWGLNMHLNVRGGNAVMPAIPAITILGADDSGNNGGLVGIGTCSPPEPLSVSFAAHGLISQHRQSCGVGVGQNFYMKFNNVVGTAVNYAGIYADVQSNTNGAHNGRMILQVANAGSLLSALTISNNGTISTTCNLSVGTSVDAGGGFGTMIAYQPYGAASFSCNLNVLPDGTYIVTASMVRGGDGINQTYSAMFIYHHYIGSGGTDIINTIVSSTAPGNNNGQLSLSGTTISIGWGGARGPASISALRLRTI